MDLHDRHNVVLVWRCVYTLHEVVSSFTVKQTKTLTTQGIAKPNELAGGISTALITTAAGLIVALPALVAYRALRAQVDRLTIDMEREAMRLLDALYTRDAVKKS